MYIIYNLEIFFRGMEFSVIFRYVRKYVYIMIFIVIFFVITKMCINLLRE